MWKCTLKLKMKIYSLWRGRLDKGQAVIIERDESRITPIATAEKPQVLESDCLLLLGEKHINFGER